MKNIDLREVLSDTMIKDRRVVLRMNLSQFSREIKQKFLMKRCTFVFISIKFSSVAFFLKAQLRTHVIAPSCPYFLGFTVVKMVVVRDVYVVVVLVVVVVVMAVLLVIL